jgi:hypothetical protein
MHSPEQKVSLRRFIQIGEMLDHAFADPAPTPDYLAHQCELAEQALLRAQAALGSTADPLLAQLFALTIRQPR